MNRPIRGFYRYMLTGIAVLAGSLVGVSAKAGDLTTDNLTVNKDTAMYGILNVSAAVASTSKWAVYYSFATTNTPVPDNSGNGKTGTLSGATYTTNGLSGGAYSFDGINDYISVPITALSNTVTISGWIKARTATNSMHFFQAETDKLFLRIESGGIAKTLVKKTGAYITATSSTNAITTNVWHHFCITYDGTNLLQYIDNQVNGSDTGTAVAFSSLLCRIASHYWTVELFDGVIDQVRIYNRALSAAEVSQIYHGELTLSGAGLVQFYSGVQYVAPLGDIAMGSFTNQP